MLSVCQHPCQVLPQILIWTQVCSSGWMLSFPSRTRLEFSSISLSICSDPASLSLLKNKQTNKKTSSATVRSWRRHVLLWDDSKHLKHSSYQSTFLLLVCWEMRQLMAFFPPFFLLYFTVIDLVVLIYHEFQIKCIAHFCMQDYRLVLNKIRTFSKAMYPGGISLLENLLFI